jgi:hypothetical protein
MEEQKSWTGTNICPRCGKPYCYIGDVPFGGFPKGQEHYCTCNQETYFKQIGWVCPVCGRGVNPNLSSCPCQTEPQGVS